MNRNLLKDRKVLAAIIVIACISSFVMGTAVTYQVRQIQARESFAFANPVVVDVYKQAQDNSLIANGWNYLGVDPLGFHYQISTRNHIMNAGQTWMSSLLAKGAGDGTLVYIALGHGDTGAATDPSLAGGEIATAGLARGAAAVTGMNAAGAGTVTWSLVKTFTCLTAINGVDLAGLFTTVGANTPTLFAETTFADLVSLMVYQSGTVNLASGDTLTINHEA